MDLTQELLQTKMRVEFFKNVCTKLNSGMAVQQIMSKRCGDP